MASADQSLEERIVAYLRDAPSASLHRTPSAIAVRLDADRAEVSEAVERLAADGRIGPLEGQAGTGEAEEAWQVV